MRARHDHRTKASRGKRPVIGEKKGRKKRAKATKKQQKNKRKKAQKHQGWQTDRTAGLDALKMSRREKESGAVLVPGQCGSHVDGRWVWPEEPCGTVYLRL